MRCSFDVVGMLFIFIWNLFNLSVAITQAVLVQQIREQFESEGLIEHGNHLNNGCDWTWQYLIKSYFSLIIEGVGVICWYLGCLLINKSSLDQYIANLRKWFWTMGLHLILIQYSFLIWNGTAYDITNTCYLFWTTIAPSLWKIIFIQYINLWVNCVISIILLYKLLLRWCCSSTHVDS